MTSRKISQPPSGKPSTARDLRCECGSLVAKLSAAGIELKCRRCKRLAIIPFERFNNEGHTVTVTL